MGSCLSLPKKQQQQAADLELTSVFPEQQFSSQVQQQNGGHKYPQKNSSPSVALGGFSMEGERRAGSMPSPQLPVIPTVSSRTGRKIVKAMYDYTSAETDPSTDIPDLNFRKGEVMEILHEDGDWWLARNLATNVQGYIPSTFVVIDGGMERFDWYHGSLSRKDAERLLLLPNNARGTFLVRDSESSQGCYSLSMVDVEGSFRSVKHYRIRNLDNGGYYITTKTRCSSLEELISHYAVHADGLCYRLAAACPKERPDMPDLTRVLRDKWEIDRKRVTKQELLGSGNFGDVWKGLLDGKIVVAIKTLKPGMMEETKFLEEATVMKSMRHTRLVQLHAVVSVGQPLFIITELCEKGSLLQCLRDDAGRKLIFPKLVDIASQVAEGMRYIESKQYIHRDLAARNILVTANNSIKIGDFGLARAIDEEIYTSQPGGKFPIKWTAPEAATFGKFTIKSDVWAYGILLIELVTYGAIPYPGMTNSEVLTQLELGYRHPCPRECPQELYEIMLTCWKQNPDQRPTFEYLFHIMDDFSVATQSSYAESG